MFALQIRETHFSGVIGDAYFRRISGDCWDKDNTFVATLRAICYDCLKAGQTITFKLNQFSDFQPNTIYYLAGTKSDYENFDPGDLKENENIHKYFEKLFQVRVFIGNDRTVIITPERSISFYHLVQCVMPKLVPWAIDKDKEFEIFLSQEKLAILKTLMTVEYSAYMKSMEAASKKYDFSAARIETLLAGITRRANMKSVNAITKRIQELNDSINTTNIRLSELYQRLNNCNDQYNGIIARLDSANDNDLINYFKLNKNVKLLEPGTQGIIDFVATGTLDYFDEEQYRIAIKNKHSYFYQAKNKWSDDDVKLFFDNVFGDSPKLKLHMCAKYSLDIEGCAVGTYAKSSDLEDYYLTNLENPHIRYHSCLGNYRQTIAQSLASGNIVGAVTSCQASVSSVNTGEGITACHLVDDITKLNENSARCFVEWAETGEMMNPIQALNKLKEGNHE